MRKHIIFTLCCIFTFAVGLIRGQHMGFDRGVAAVCTLNEGFIVPEADLVCVRVDHRFRGMDDRGNPINTRELVHIAYLPAR